MCGEELVPFRNSSLTPLWPRNTTSIRCLIRTQPWRVILHAKFSAKLYTDTRRRQ